MSNTDATSASTPSAVMLVPVEILEILASTSLVMQGTIIHCSEACAASERGQWRTDWACPEYIDSGVFDLGSRKMVDMVCWYVNDCPKKIDLVKFYEYQSL